MTTPGRIRLREAARRVGVHPETLRRWAHSGMITYWSIGRMGIVEFDPKDIDALVTSFRRDRQGPPVY